jgi:hypothetical protein
MKKLLRKGSDVRADRGQRQLAKDAGLALLTRSVRMRHRRLAVQRLHDALSSSGAHVSSEQWAYCRAAAAASGDMAVRASFARSEASLRADRAPALEGPPHG